jgi:uncharacterized membrane protein
MQSRSRVLGHAIHPMLIVFPLGLLGTAAIFDLIHLATGSTELVSASFWMIPAGILTGLLAAVFGLWDWLAIPGDTRARGVGLWHGATMVVVVVLFTIAWLLRASSASRAASGLPLLLEILALVLALVGGWLGGELVERLGVGIDAGANLRASSSLTGTPAEPGPASMAHRA